MAKKKLNSGTILLAEPFMADPNFKRAAVILCEHHSEGSIGFILNKLVDMKINDLIASFPEFDAEVYYGGPVHTDTIHYIHNKGDLLEGSHQVAEGVYWGGDFEKLKFLVSSQLIEPKDIRFFVGYSGWSADQLKDEMEMGSWVLADLDANYVFNAERDSLWSEIMKNKGNTYSVIAQMPDYVNWN